MKRKDLLGSQFGRFQSMSGWHCCTGAVLMVGSLWENKLVTWGLHHSNWEAKIRMRCLHPIIAFKDILQKLKASHEIRSFKMSAPSTVSPMRVKSYHTCWWGWASLVTAKKHKAYTPLQPFKSTPLSLWKIWGYLGDTDFKFAFDMPRKTKQVTSLRFPDQNLPGSLLETKLLRALHRLCQSV